MCATRAQNLYYTYLLIKYKFSHLCSCVCVCAVNTRSHRHDIGRCLCLCRLRVSTRVCVWWHQLVAERPPPSTTMPPSLSPCGWCSALGACRLYTATIYYAMRNRINIASLLWHTMSLSSNRFSGNKRVWLFAGKKGPHNERERKRRRKKTHRAHREVFRAVLVNRQTSFSQQRTTRTYEKRAKFSIMTTNSLFFFAFNSMLYLEIPSVARTKWIHIGVQWLQYKPTVHNSYTFKRR